MPLNNLLEEWRGLLILLSYQYNKKKKNKSGKFQVWHAYKNISCMYVLLSNLANLSPVCKAKFVTSKYIKIHHQYEKRECFVKWISH